MVDTRDRIIQGGISKGYRVEDINKQLSKANLPEYNPLTYLPNYMNLPREAVTDLSDLGKGLTTAGAEFIKGIYDLTTPIYKAKQGEKMEAVKQAFKKAVVDNERTKRLLAGTAIGAGAGSVIPGVGTLGGALTGGMVGLLGPKDFANAALSTYNTRVEDLPFYFEKGNLLQPRKKASAVDYKDIAQGIFQNPLFATMDIAGVGGAGKKIGQASKAVTSKAGNVQQLLPGSNLAEFNREITNAKQWSRTKNADIYQGYNALARSPLAKRQEIVKNIVSNTGELNEIDKKIAELLKADLKRAEQTKIGLGILEPEYSKQNTIAQYVMDNVRDESNLLHKDIMDIIQGKPLRESALKMFNDSPLGDRVLNLIQKGEDLYKNNNIAFLTQKLAGSTDPLGEVIARHVNLENPLSSDYARVIGRANPESLANVLDDSIKMQLDRSAHLREGLDVFKDILDSKNIPIDLSKSQKSKYMKAFRDSLKQDEKLGLQPDLAKALDNSAIDTLLPGGKQNIFYKAMKGGLEYEGTGSFLDRISGDWKKNVLGNPSWIAGNRLGNWSLNAIEGVNLKDYADAAKYKNLIPQTLKQQTSFNSYINKGSEVLSRTKDKSFRTVAGESINDIKRTIGRYKNSERTLSDKAKLSTELYNNLSNLTANQFFAVESLMEYTDRAANFVRQAKREAKVTGKSLEDILKQAQTDKELFFKLNNEVNKSLGDYIGRNYAAPKAVRDTLRLGVPFGKFFTQTFRTTLHDIANHPLAFATNVTLPARAGLELSDVYERKNRLNPDWYKGGVPYEPKRGNTRVMGIAPTPIGIIGSRFRSPEDLFSMASPLLTLPTDIATYQKFGKQATSPRRTLVESNPRLARELGMKSGYQPSTGERVAYGANQFLTNTFNPYMLATRYAPGTYGMVTGEGMHTLYDTMQPIKYKLDKRGRRVYEIEGRKYDRLKSKVQYTTENPTTYKKDSPIELLGNLFGISTQSNYIPRKSQSSARRQINKARQIKQKIETNR